MSKGGAVDDRERRAVLARCSGLHTTDVGDGMDHCGLQDVGLDPDETAAEP